MNPLTQSLQHFITSIEAIIQFVLIGACMLVPGIAGLYLLSVMGKREAKPKRLGRRA